MSGWIKLHRDIQNHWIWNEKPFDKRSAWIDILMMVNHEDKKILLGNELIEVKRGSRITSIRQLCERWGWSNTKVKRFLKLLEDDGMLIVKSDTKKTVVTVVNYSEYQDINDTKTTRKRHENDTKTTQTHTNKNDKNDKNEKNDKNNINISLQIKNLRDRYSDKQLKIIDDYFDILRWTRRTGKIADSVILKIYQEWEKYPIEKVVYALHVYINNPKLHDKKENYCYGIMRNATAEEIEKYKEKRGGGNATNTKYFAGYKKSAETERLDRIAKERGWRTEFEDTVCDF